MKVEGACHCGYIAFDAEADPQAVRICHCTDCQTLTGSAYRVTVQAENFQLRSGTPSIYIKTADSGIKRAHAFCPRCGTPIYSAAPEATGSCGVRVGTLRQRAALPPKRQIWWRSALPWVTDLRSVAHVDTQ